MLAALVGLALLPLIHEWPSEKQINPSQMSISDCWSRARKECTHLWLPDDHRHMRIWAYAHIDRSTRLDSLVRRDAIYMHLSRLAGNACMYDTTFRHVAYYFYLLVDRDLMMMRFSCESKRIGSSHSSTTHICWLSDPNLLFLSSIVIFPSSVTY